MVDYAPFPYVTPGFLRALFPKWEKDIARSASLTAELKRWRAEVEEMESRAPTPELKEAYRAVSRSLGDAIKACDSVARAYRTPP